MSMKSQREMKFRYLMFKIKYIILAIIQLPVSLVKYERLKRHSLKDAQYFYIYWIFDELHKAMETQRIEAYRGSFETQVIVDDRYVMNIWHQNQPYSDMKLAVYKKEYGENVCCNRTHVFEDLPPYYIACKMRAFDRKVLNTRRRIIDIPFHSQYDSRIAEPELITTELLTDIITAKRLETL